MATVNSIEPNDTFSQANAVTLGNTAIGALSSSTDWDMYKVVMASSGVLKLEMSSSQLSDWAYTVRVYDASQNILGSGYLGYIQNGAFSVGMQTAGTYYIGVTSNNIYSGLSYSITPSLGTGSASDYEHESNETLATATPISLDHVITGQRWKSTDVDYFSFTVDSTGLLTFDFKCPEKYSYESYQISIYDGSGNLVETKTTGGHLTFIESIGTPGKYFAEIKQADGGTYEEGDYQFLAHLDSTSVLATQTVLSSASPINASIASAAQHDWYRIDLTAGTMYEFSLSGAQSGGGNLATPSLSLCAFDGRSLESSTNLPTWSSGDTVYTADPQIAFTAPYSGSYYLMVDGLGGTGSYTLRQETDILGSLIPNLLGTTSVGSLKRWGFSLNNIPVTVNYSFLNSTADGEAGFKAMTASQKQAVRDVLAQYSAVANIDFIELSDPTAAQIRYGTSDQHGVSGGVCYTEWNSNGLLTLADVFINNTPSSSTGTAESSSMYAGGYGLEALIHETGHALGLKHPGDYDTVSGAADGPFMPVAWDNRAYSVMSYIDDQNALVFNETPGLLDIAAVQYLYGTRSSTSSQTFSFASSSEFDQSILANGVQQTLDLSNQTEDFVVSLIPGTLSSIGLKSDGTGAHNNLAIPFGSSINQVIGGSGNDFIAGNTKNDIISSGAGNDIIVSGSGNDTVDGGVGVDTLVLGGALSNFTVTKTATGYTATDKTSASGADTLTNVERMRFADSALALDVDGVGGQAYRLYQAAFNRKPDIAGLGWWISYMDKGMSLTEVAAHFEGSAEFISLYGANLSNAEFVTQLYQNVLHRDPEPGALPFWGNILETGQQSRPVVLMNFSESPENQSQIIGSVQSGMEYTIFI